MPNRSSTTRQWSNKKDTVMKNSRIPRKLSCALLLALGACAHMSEDNGALPQRELASAQLAQSIKLAHEGWPPALWWTQYGDTQLNALIAQALRDGPSMQAANARFATARATLQFNVADQGAKLDADAAINRQRYSGNGFFPPPIGGAWYTETTPQLVATYNVDWWGKHKAAIGAAVGEVNARLAENAAAEEDIVTAVAQTYYGIQADLARLDNLRQLQDLQQQLVVDKAKRISHGVAASSAERQAEIDLGATRQQVTRGETEVAHEREALRALIGGDAQALADFAPHPLPRIDAALPANLGGDLLARRPDLQAARWRVEASLDRIDSAKAAFYPDINLTGFVGNDVIAFEDLLKAPSRTFFLGATFNLPLFDNGRLDARLAASRSKRNEAIADYNEAVVDAVREVAQRGVAIQGMQKLIAEQNGTSAASKALLQGAQARYMQGLADQATLLSAQLGVVRQRDAELQLQGQQIQNDIALVKALGGGYLASQNDAPALSQQ
jgi:multidrug efflux system outer membrane protein